MAEWDPYAKHITGIVDFVLRTYRVRVNWSIAALDDGEWTKISWEMSNLDMASRNNWEQIRKLLDDPTVKKDIPTLLKLREAAQLASQTLVEYGTVPSHNDYLGCDAVVVHVSEMLTLPNEMPHLQPFMGSMARENRHVDFLILVNSSRFSNVSYNEKLAILAHEAVHIVKSARNSQRRSFVSIETKVKELVSDFKKRVK